MILELRAVRNGSAGDTFYVMLRSNRELTGAHESIMLNIRGTGSLWGLYLDPVTTR